MIPIFNIFLKDSFVVVLIIINAIAIFLNQFPSIRSEISIFETIDHVVSFLFLVEMMVKINHFGYKRYVKDSWNKMDMIINFFLIPSLILPFFDFEALEVITVLRLIRLGKFFRFFKFVPNIDRIVSGLHRAMKASVFIFVALSLYLFIISILSCFMFSTVSPEHFGNPFLSLYSIFKIFTIEGWYELPELIAQSHGDVAAFFIKIYFIFIVFSGGICGIGLINAIFVDEIVADNNDEVLNKVEELRKQIEELTKEIKK